MNENITPLASNGYPVQPDSLESFDNGILAVLPDDMVVRLVGHDQIRVGGGDGCGSVRSTGIWHWTFVRQGEAGHYGIMESLPYLIDFELGNREASGLPIKQWKTGVMTLGHQFLTDPELAAEAIQYGLAYFLANNIS